MSEGPQQDNRPTLGSGIPPVSPQYYPASREANNEGPERVLSAADQATEYAMNKCEQEKQAIEEHNLKLTESLNKKVKTRTYVAIAGIAAATLFAIGGIFLVNRLQNNAPLKDLEDSNRRVSGLETVVAALKATGTRLSGDNNALVNSRDSISSTNKTNLDLLNACVTDKNALQQGNNQLRDSSNNAQATIDSLKATNEALSGRLTEISNTVLSPSQVISLVAQALTNGDHETLKWFESYGCKLPTETPTSTSTTGFIPSWTPTPTQTPTSTPTQTPTSTPVSTEPPHNPTNTPEQFKTPTKSNPPTQIPPVTRAPEPTRTPVPPTATEMPTVVPTPTKASFPTQIPGVTRTVVHGINNEN